MSEMTSQPHIKASLEFVGRFLPGTQPVESDFRVECDFGVPDMRNMAYMVLDSSSISARKALANVWLLFPEFQKERLRKGQSFSIWSGQELVAQGEIVAVIDAALSA